MFGAATMGGSGPAKSEISPYIYTNYTKFLASGDRNGLGTASEADFVARTSRTVQPYGAESRNVTTCIRHWAPPGGISGGIESCSAVTIVLATATDDGTTAYPTSITVNGVSYTATNWFQDGEGSGVGNGSVSLVYFTYYGYINGITDISATYDGPGGNNLGLQHVFMIPGIWNADGGQTATVGSDTGGTTSNVSLNKNEIAFFYGIHSVDALPTVTIAGSNIQEIGRTQGKWYNGLVIGWAHATANSTNFTATIDRGWVGISKLKFVNG